MPQRNTVKIFSPNTYYHVYSRGVSGQKIFTDEIDYSIFLSLFKRYLSKNPTSDHMRRAFPHLKNSAELLAYCLMPSHFHLLVFNKKTTGLTKLMRSVITSYSLAFNKRHKRRGRLFESTYKASLIDDESYLWHISRYIHLNPQDLGLDYKSYPYSSYAYYLGKKDAEWINPKRILKMHADWLNSYPAFVDDYKEMRAEIKQIKIFLADS
jgi:putative transposase